MRIVYFSHSDGIYGAPRSLLDMILSLKERNLDFYPIVITSKNNELNARCSELGIENYSVYYADCLYEYEVKRSFGCLVHDIRVSLKMKYRHDTVNLKAIKYIEGKIDFSTVDIIHTNVSTIDIGAIIANKYGIKHIWHIREYGKSDKRRFLPFVRNYYDYIEKSSTSIILISNYVKENWIKQGLSTNKAIVLYDVVSRPYYEDAEKNGAIKILFAGSTNPAKGVYDLLEAANVLVRDMKIANFMIDLCGNYDNDFGKSVSRWIDENDMQDYIHILGYDANLTDSMYKYDVGVVCSRSEALGRVTIEYMEAGLCLVASDTGANPELVDGCSEAILYEQGNSQDLARKLRGLINLDRNAQVVKGKRIRNYALNRFGKDSFVKELLLIYGMEN